MSNTFCLLLLRDIRILLHFQYLYSLNLKVNFSMWFPLVNVMHCLFIIDSQFKFITE